MLINKEILKKELVALILYHSESIGPIIWREILYLKPTIFFQVWINFIFAMFTRFWAQKE